jgi:hypothetical protein
MFPPLYPPAAVSLSRSRRFTVRSAPTPTRSSRVSSLSVNCCHFSTWAFHNVFNTLILDTSCVVRLSSSYCRPSTTRSVIRYRCPDGDLLWIETRYLSPFLLVPILVPDSFPLFSFFDGLHRLIRFWDKLGDLTYPHIHIFRGCDLTCQVKQMGR